MKDVPQRAGAWWALAIIVAGCGTGSGGAASAPPGPAVAAPAEAEWTRCESDAECDAVQIACCPCTAGDWTPANHASVAAVAARHPVTGCDRCPQQDCPRVERVCVSGHCTLR